MVQILNKDDTKIYKINDKVDFSKEATWFGFLAYLKILNQSFSH